MEKKSNCAGTGDEAIGLNHSGMHLSRIHPDACFGGDGGGRRITSTRRCAQETKVSRDRERKVGSIEYTLLGGQKNGGAEKPSSKQFPKTLKSA